MIKRILVALDPDLDTSIAMRYATSIAEQHGAEVSGLAVADSRQFSIGGGAFGSMYYEDMLRKSLTERAHEEAKHLTENFQMTAEQTHVPHEEWVEEGIPYERIMEDMRYHDLLVIGHEPHFIYNMPEVRTNTLAHVVKRGTIPVLVTRQAYHEIKRVVLAYDGQDPAVRSMHQFALLHPFGKDIDVFVVHVREGESSEAVHHSERLLRESVIFLEAHGFSRIQHASLRHGSIGKRLIEFGEIQGADLIIAGAHSVSAVRRLVFGSATDYLMRDCTVPLFLHH